MRPLAVIHEEKVMTGSPRHYDPSRFLNGKKLRQPGDSGDSHRRSNSTPRTSEITHLLSRRPRRHRSQQARPPQNAAVAVPVLTPIGVHGAAVFDVATVPATGGTGGGAAGNTKSSAMSAVWTKLRKSLSRSEPSQGSRRSRSRSTSSRSRRRCSGSPGAAARSNSRCPCCGAKENHMAHLGQQRNIIYDAALGLVCLSCQRKREIAAWRRLSDWRASIRDLNFLSLQKHYKFELPNQADSAAFSLHNRDEERMFFAVSHTMEARSSHLPEGWEMVLYVPNPAVDKDILNVLDERSIDAYPIIQAVRPSGSSLLSYFTREPVVLWEHAPCTGGEGGTGVHTGDRKHVLAYMYYSRTPFTVLRVENNQHRKMLEICRVRKGNKRRKIAQEWIVYTANREVAIAKIFLFLDDCKSIAGRDATIHFETHLESNVKVVIVVSVCYIQYVCFGRCSGADI